MVKLGEAEASLRQKGKLDGLTSLRVCIVSAALLLCGFGSLLVAQSLSFVGGYPELKIPLFVFSVGVAVASGSTIFALYFLNLAIGSLSKSGGKVVAGRRVRAASFGVWAAATVAAILLAGAIFVSAGGPLLWPMLAVLVISGVSAAISLGRWAQLLAV